MMTWRLSAVRGGDVKTLTQSCVFGAGSRVLGSESNVFQKSLTQTEEADSDVLLRHCLICLWILGHTAQILLDGFDAV